MCAGARSVGHRSGSDRLLLRELGHPIDNELTIAIGIIALATARAGSPDAKETLESVQNSLLNFVRVHQALRIPTSRPRTDGYSYLRQLCEAIERSKLDPMGIELEFVSHSLSIDSEQCWRMGMIIFELVTNAANHAFRDIPGTIRVEVVNLGSTIRCCVRDDGIAASPQPLPGEGLRIIEALTQELRGRFDQLFGATGSVSTLTFPCAHGAIGDGAPESQRTHQLIE
jgi:two-component sensor histidine kinase